MSRARGFTLVELVVAIIVIAVGFLGISRLLGDSIAPMVSAEKEQLAAQYAQECIEKLLADRRSNGYSSVTTSSCDSLTALPSGYSRSVTSSTSTGTSTTACPNVIACNTLTVTVSNGSISAAPSVMLVSY